MSQHHRIGIDLGGTKIEGVVLDAELRPIWRQRMATESQGGYEHILDRLCSLVALLKEQAPRANALGIGTPGSVSSRDGRMKNCNTTCLNGHYLREDLEERLGIEVRIENDANLFALAEAQAGSGRGAKTVFGVILGTGVGGGIVHRGKLWVGPQHLAGEWGHHKIESDGPPCYCGQRGCVETWISGPAVQRQYLAQTGVAAAMPAIVDAARQGEAAAVAVFDAFLDRFGRALSNIINILDPEVIVLGGGLSNIDELYDRGHAAVRRYVFNDELRTQIRRHALGDSAGVIGAALLT